MSSSEQTFVYEFGEWVVEPHLNRIRRGTESIQLEPRTLEVLRYLLDHAGEIVSLDELLDTVWAGRVVEPNAIHRNVNRIRQVLGDNPREPTYIETITKRGYRAIAPVRRVEVTGPTDSTLLAELEAVTPPFPAYEGDEPYVFVCYCHDDREQVYRELNRLRAAGINVWYDEGIAIGAEWTDEIAKAIANCAHILYFVSRKAVASSYCLDEVQLARNENKPLVAVHLERTVLPPSLQLSIGRFQALMKYAIPEREYARKLLQTLGLYGKETARRDWRVSFEWTSRAAKVAVIAALVLAVGVFLVRGPGLGVFFHDTLENSIKVAPFKDRSPTHGQEWMSDTIVDYVRLAAPRSGLQVVGSQADWNAGDSRYRLEGSLMRTAEWIQVNAELISVANGYQVWVGLYERPIPSDPREQFEVARVQREIAELIVKELASKIDVVGAPTLIETRPDGVQTGALQEMLNAQQSFPEFPSFGEGGRHE